MKKSLSQPVIWAAGQGVKICGVMKLGRQFYPRSRVLASSASTLFQIGCK